MSRLDLCLDGIKCCTGSLQRLLDTAAIAQSLLQVAPRLYHMRRQEEDLLPGRPNYGGCTTGPGLDTRGCCTSDAPDTKNGGEDNEKNERPEQDDRCHPSDGSYLWWHSDGGCGKSPNAARFPLSIADEGAELTFFQNPLTKFVHFHHKCYCRS
jgi:hypothetical protein